LPPEPVTIGDVEDARDRIAGIVLQTPAVDVRIPGVAADVLLKTETVQPTGSFKVRGAASKLTTLGEEQRGRGVVTASTGNHGRAVAHVAADLGVPATVCVSANVPAGKLRALESLGCRILIGGDSQTAALDVASRLVNDEELTLVHPFDDRQVIAGQGTIGLEIADRVSEVTDVIVPLSGGGLIAGVALAVKERVPGVRVVGVSMRRAAVMAASVAAGRPVELPEEPTLADSLQGGIGAENRHTLAMVTDLVDEIVLLDEVDIWTGMLWAYHMQGMVLEGGGAVGIGALLAGKITPRATAVVVCSGGNIEPEHLHALARRQDCPTR
jgi:threonine dehydratase